jgi:hypothetical protein
LISQARNPAGSSEDNLNPNFFELTASDSAL